MASIPEWLKRHDEPKTVASRSSAEEVLDLLNKHPHTTIILDLRNDIDTAHFERSFHIPATSIDGSKHVKERVIDPLLQQEPTLETIVVHCNGSKNRATKVAGWIEDYVEESDSPLKVTVLDGGITNWLELDDSYKKHLVYE